MPVQLLASHNLASVKNYHRHLRQVRFGIWRDCFVFFFVFVIHPLSCRDGYKLSNVLGFFFRVECFMTVVTKVLHLLIPFLLGVTVHARFQSFADFLYEVENRNMHGLTIPRHSELETPGMTGCRTCTPGVDAKCYTPNLRFFFSWVFDRWIRPEPRPDLT